MKILANFLLASLLSIGLIACGDGGGSGGGSGGTGASGGGYNLGGNDGLADNRSDGLVDNRSDGNATGGGNSSAPDTRPPVTPDDNNTAPVIAPGADLVMKIAVLDSLLVSGQDYRLSLTLFEQRSSAALKREELPLDRTASTVFADIGFFSFGSYYLDTRLSSANGTLIAARRDTLEFARRADDAYPPVPIELDWTHALLSTLDSPYELLDEDADGVLEIWHPQQLAAFADPEGDISLAGSYELIRDLDLSAYANWRPIGNGSAPFSGTLRGNNHRISGLNSRGYVHGGLFGRIANASISDLQLEAGQITAANYSGALAGAAYNSSISGVAVTAERISVSRANASAADFYAGGLLGAAVNSSLVHNTVELAGGVEISLPNTGGAVNAAVGGLAGYIDGGKLKHNSVSGAAEIVIDVAADDSIRAAGPDSPARAGLVVGELKNAQLNHTRLSLHGAVNVSAELAGAQAGGIAGSCIRANISGLIAAAQAPVLAASASYHSYAGGVLGHGEQCRVTDAALELNGGLTAQAGDRREAYVGGVFGAGERLAATEARVQLQGGLSSSGGSNLLGLYAGFGTDCGPAVNVTVDLRGDIANRARGEEVHTDASFGGFSADCAGANTENVRLSMQGDVSLYARLNDISFGGFFADAGINGRRVELRDSSVELDGTVNIYAFGASVSVGGLLARYLGQGMSIADSYAHISGRFNVFALPRALGGATVDYIKIGGLVGELDSPLTVADSYFALDGELIINFDGAPAPRYFGGALGLDAPAELLTLDSAYFNMQTVTELGLINNVHPNHRNYVQLRCPTAPGGSCAGPIGPNNPASFIGWDPAKWDFGTSSDLPTLR